MAPSGLEKLLKTLLLGTAAGIIDVIPMVLQGVSWQANVSALLHWLGLSIIITYAKLPFTGWASGIILGLLTGVPIAILASETDSTAWMPILLSSVILGGLLGFMSERLITSPFKR